MTNEEQKLREIARALYNRAPSLTEEQVTSIISIPETLEEMERLLSWVQSTPRVGYQSALINALDIVGEL